MQELMKTNCLASIKASLTMSRLVGQQQRPQAVANPTFRRFSSSSSAKPRDDNKIWFQAKGGLSFKCTSCGKCCTGKGGKVWVNAAEEQQMAHELHVEVDALRDFYLDQEEGKRWSIKMKKSQQHGDDNSDSETRCIFLKENLCSIYKARPTQCRTFPWWPQHVASEHDWKVAAMQCPGIEETSPLVPSETIVNNLVVHIVHRTNDDDSMTYNDMIQSLEQLDPGLMDEFRDDFFRNHSRHVLYEDDELVIMNNRLGASGRTRSLHFKNSLTFGQSEIAINEKTHELDHDRLLFDVHQAMCRALEWIPSPIQHMAVIGTGAGAIPMYLHRNFPGATIDCVDSSSNVLDLAKVYFGLTTNAQIRLLALSGESYSSPHPLDILMIDVATDTIPPSVPPPSMLSDDFLLHAKAQLSRFGLLVFNVVVADQKALSGILEKIKCHFDFVHHVELDNNWVVYAAKSSPPDWRVRK